MVLPLRRRFGATLPVVIAVGAALAASACGPPTAAHDPVPGATAQGTAGGSAGGSAASGGTGSPSPAAIVSTQLSPARAVARLKQAGISALGKPQAALSWHEGKTLSVLLVTVQTAAVPGGKHLITTRAYLAGGLGAAGTGRLVDLIADQNGGPCDVDAGAQAVPGSLTVSDRDGDGQPEATAGWWMSCRGDPGPVNVTLILFTHGRHYQLKGVGQVRSQPLPSPYAGIAPVNPKASPADDLWPTGLYAPMLTLFHRLYL